MNGESETRVRNLEERKLELEIAELGRVWWKNPSYLGAVGPTVIGLAALLVGFVNGYFDVSLKRTVLEKERLQFESEKLEGDVKAFQAQRRSLADSLATMAWRQEALEHELAQLRGEAALLPHVSNVPHGLDLQKSWPSKDLIETTLATFDLGSRSTTSIEEASEMVKFMNPERISLQTADYVSGVFASGAEVTIWPNTYDKRNCYGVRYGLPQPGRPYFGSNETYFEICK